MNPPLDDSCPDCEDVCGNLEPGGCLAVTQEEDEDPRLEEEELGIRECPKGYDGR